MNYVFLGIAVGFPWNALISSTDYYATRLITIPLSTFEASLTLVYLSSSLITFMWLNRPVKEENRNERQLELLFIRSYFALNCLAFLILAFSPWYPSILSEDRGLFVLVMCVGACLGSSSACYQVSFQMFARLNRN
jgi:hypothetical protein